MTDISDNSCRGTRSTFYVQYHFFRKSCRLWNNAGKYGWSRQAADDH